MGDDSREYSVKHSDQVNRLANNPYTGVDRRKFLKGSAAGIVGVGLAGCGGNGGGSDSTPTPSEPSNDATPAGDLTATSTEDFSDVTFSFWSSTNINTESTQTTMAALANAFQTSTGAKMNINWSGYGQVIGAGWRNQFRQGNQPVLYDSNSAWDGQFIEGGWVKPFDEYRDRFDQETLDALEWIFPIMEGIYSGFDADIYEVPFGVFAQIPHLARMDHFDEAGLSRDRYPPEDYEDLIDIATTLQNDGPGDWGYQIHGTRFDVTDSRLPHMAVADGGLEGTFLTADWSDTRWDNDTWKSAVRRWTEIYTEHGLSDPSTPQSDDETVIGKIVNGTVSMTSADQINQSTLLAQAPDLMENGDIQWGAGWTGDDGFGPIIWPFVLGITRPPEGANEQEWEKKQNAAIEFMKIWLSYEVQLELFERMGWLPVRSDVWSELPSYASKPLETGITMLEAAAELDEPPTWSAHPQMVSIQYNDPAPIIQNVLRGQLEPEAACEQIAETVRNQYL